MLEWLVVLRDSVGESALNGNCVVKHNCTLEAVPALLLFLAHRHKAAGMKIVR